MLKRLLLNPLAIVLLFIAIPMTGIAEDAKKPDLSKLQAALGGATPDSVAESVLSGLYEITLGSQILYLSEDGRYVMQGDVVDLVSSNNLTENRRNGLRAKAIDDVGEENMIVFAPQQEAKYEVTVFTDIDCGYCRKLHQEIASYNDLGISVRYLMFPRAGVNSESFNKAVSAWCADDRNDAITKAKLGESIETKTCDNPVGNHYNLGQQLGVRGTPSIILASGEMVPGYVPADRLMEMLK